MLVLMLMSKCEPAVMYDDRVINDRVFGHISQTRRRDFGFLKTRDALYRYIYSIKTITKGKTEKLNPKIKKNISMKPQSQ